MFPFCVAVNLVAVMSPVIVALVAVKAPPDVTLNLSVIEVFPRESTLNTLLIDNPLVPKYIPPLAPQEELPR